MKPLKSIALLVLTAVLSGKHGEGKDKGALIYSEK